MTSMMPEEQHSRMAGKVDVMVTADPGTGGELVNWTYEAKFHPGSGGSNGKNVMKFAKGSGAHRIDFTLTDNTGYGLAFYDTPEEAMWVATGTSCPPPGPGDGDGGGEIQFLHVKKGVLSVINKNHNPGDLCYALRFDGQPQLLTPPYVYDPIMNNGGR